MFGWVVERRERGGPGDFDNVSHDQLDRDLIRDLMVRGMTEDEAIAFLRRGTDAPVN